MYRAIYDGVLNRRLKPGHKLPEASLRELFNTSRFAVRKVLQQLANDHVVDLQPNRGARIVMPSPEEAQHVCETRRALESVIVELATQRATKADLADLRRQLGKEHSAMHTADEVVWARMASSFHHRVARLARNPILESYLGQILSRFSLIVALYELPDNPSCEHDEHERIVDCMERGDAAGAVRWMELHLRDLESTIMVKRNPPEESLADLLGLARQRRNMGIETFTTATKHGHVKGTASADRHDFEDFADYLKKSGVLAASDFVAGIELFSAPEGPEQNARVFVTALVSEVAGREALAKAVEAGPVKVRKLTVEMSLNKFFGLFKRFSIRISPGGLLDGHEILTDE